MSERRPADEMTDPGPPPEEALDATLRALGAPVPAQARRTPESAGLDAAHYHAEPHRPPRAHEPPSSSKVATTEPMGASVPADDVRGTMRTPPREERLDLTTVPRAAPAPSRMSTFVGALVFVVVVLGVATWALLRGGAQPGPAATVSSATTAPASGTAVVVGTPVPSPTAPPAPTASTIASSDNSSATNDPPRPTGGTPPTTPPSAALPRHVPTAATSAAAAPSAPAALPTAPATAPAPTTKYNRFLEEDKK